MISSARHILHVPSNSLALQKVFHFFNYRGLYMRDNLTPVVRPTSSFPRVQSDVLNSPPRFDALWSKRPYGASGC